MRAIQESVARSRQAALEKKKVRLEQDALKREAEDRIDALRLQKERCFKAREDLMKEIDLAHEQEALGFLEEIRADPEMLIFRDRYGSSLLHEACSRGMKQLAFAVLAAADEEKLTAEFFQRDYRGQTPLHRAAAAGSGEICAELCKHPLCRAGMRDADGRTAWQVASFWGFDAAADAIFRALHHVPTPDLRVDEPQERPESLEPQAKRKPSKQPKGKKGSKDKKQLQRPPSKDKPPSSAGSQERGASPSSQAKRGSLASSQGKRGSLTSQGKRLSAASSQPEEKPLTPSRSKEKPASPPLESKDTLELAEELFPEAPPEPEQAGDGEEKPDPATEEDTQPGLTDEDEDADEEEEDEGPVRPPLPEDLGHRAGFESVSEGRLEDAMALIRLPLWPFTNELNARGWTLLHVAAHGGLEELCAALCRRKDFLCVDMPDKEFCATPLHLAAGKRRPACCEAIVQSGRCMKVNAQDLNGQTPLHLAALRGDELSYLAIAAHPDCDPLIPDKHGRSPCEYAATRGLQVECPVPGHEEIDL